MKIDSNLKIILASKSPRRQMLLKQIGLDFKIIPSNVDEDLSIKLKPEEFHKIILKEAKSDQFHYVNNVYKMDDIPLNEISTEEKQLTDNDWSRWKRAVYPHSPKSEKEFF